MEEVVRQSTVVRAWAKQKHGKCVLVQGESVVLVGLFSARKH